MDLVRLAAVCEIKVRRGSHSAPTRMHIDQGRDSGLQIALHDPHLAGAEMLGLFGHANTLRGEPLPYVGAVRRTNGRWFRY